MPTYEERLAQREMLQRKAIADATAVGFRDCHAVFDALGYDRVNAGGYTRSSLQVACKAIDDAGHEVEYIVADGYGSIPKAERIGCYADALPEIVAYRDAIDLARQQAEWDAAVPSAIEARRQEGPITKFMNWDMYIESWGERPVADSEAVAAAAERREAIEQAERQADRARDVVLLAAISGYIKAGGRVNQRGRPYLRDFNLYIADLDVGRITRADRNELWAKVAE